MHRIGEPFSLHERPEVFQLVIEDHVDSVNPAKYKINLAPVNPLDAFVTSGDAVKKAEEVERQFLAVAERVEHLLSESDNAPEPYLTAPDRRGHEALRQEAYCQAGRTRALINKLILAKGGSIFLETEWAVDRTLLVIPKDPRNRD